MLTDEYLIEKKMETIMRIIKMCRMPLLILGFRLVYFELYQVILGWALCFLCVRAVNLLSQTSNSDTELSGFTQKHALYYTTNSLQSQRLYSAVKNLILSNYRKWKHSNIQQNRLLRRIGRASIIPHFLEV